MRTIACKGFILALVLLFSITVFAQTNFTLKVEELSVKQALMKIEEATGYRFAYSDSEIDADKILNLALENVSIVQILEKLKATIPCSAEIVGNTILLSPAAIPKDFFLIQGRVIDSLSLKGIPGVTIYNQKSGMGTISDSVGNFSFRIPENDPTVLASSIGFKNKIVQVHSDTTILLVFQEIVKALSEVVVVAFGTENRDLLTGSVSVIKPNTFGQLNNASFNSSMQAISSGIHVSENSGTPGAANKIQIRGIGSITAGTKPLYVVDGVPIITGDFSQLNFSGQSIDAINDINLNDVASITVLKDAASSSLFGSSSSNGVILINTKRGLKNQKQIEFQSYFGMQKTTGMLDMLNASQYMHMINEEEIAAGFNPVYSAEQIATNTINTHWQNEVFRVAPIYAAHLSLKGGSDKSTYYLSSNYLNQQGIVIGSDYEQYAFRGNYDYELNSRLKLAVGNSITFSNSNRIEGDQSLNGPLPNAIALPPIFPVYNADGTYNNDGAFSNPVAIATEEKNLSQVFRDIFNVSLNYQFSKSLSLKSLVGIDYYNLQEQTFIPKTTRLGLKYNGLGIDANSNSNFIYSTNYLNYYLKYRDHFLKITGGISFERFHQHDNYLRVQDFPGDSFELLSAGASIIDATSDDFISVGSSLFARLKYGYSEKYFVTLNLRQDGSSKFGPNHKFGYFPSVAGLWYLSKEDFFNSDHGINKLKLNVSYGVTGNDDIENFLFMNLLAAGANYNGQSGIRPYQIANADLKWEATQQFNLGFEMQVWKRLHITFDFYDKKTKDLLLEKPLGNSLGFSSYPSNIGKLKNSGIEYEISANLLEKKVRWDVYLNMSHNKNEVLELYQNQPIRNVGRANSSIAVGEPISYFYGFRSLGVNPDNGLLIYDDINKDGEITDEDRTKIGSPHPVFFGGVRNMVAYKQVTLDFLISYSYGNDIFNSTRLYTETLSNDNQTVAVLNRWKQPGDITDVPKASAYNERISSRFVEDGSYLRLKYLKLSYLLSSKMLKNLPFAHIEMYAMGKNLLTLTNYSGIDPEVNYNGSNNIVLGTDFFTAPQPKSLIFGVCAKF